MVAVPLTVPGLEPEAGPTTVHGQDEVHVAAGVYVVRDAGDDLDHGESAVGGGQRAPRRGDGVGQVERAERGVKAHPFGVR